MYTDTIGGPTAVDSGATWPQRLTDDDVIYGGSGNDYLDGGNGNDTCANTENPISCTP
jgi:Ca2+-binding RTX toxin-like protein